MTYDDYKKHILEIEQRLNGNTAKRPECARELYFELQRLARARQESPSYASSKVM